MKTFVKAIILIIIITVTVSPLIALCEEENAAQSIYDGIISCKLAETNAVTVQEFIDGYLTEKAGTVSETYIHALVQSSEYDFSGYLESLKKYLSENKVSASSSRMKYALILNAVCSESDTEAAEYISDTAQNSIGKQGIMSWVFGLHMVNNGISCSYTAEDIIAKLLEFQLEDGGFAVTGTRGDIDVTAMAIQSLAQYYGSEQVKAAADKAVQMLSSRQNDDGDFSSYGVSNAESTAQVIIALSSIGIDCNSDSRFIKNGKTPFDGLKKYMLADGNFCHDITVQGDKIEKKANETAAAQALCAAVAYTRMQNGKSGFYIFDKQQISHVSPEITARPQITHQPASSPANESDKTDYKMCACIFIAASAFIICAVLFAIKKRHWKNFLAVILIAAAAICFVVFTDFQSTNEFYSGDETLKENVIGTVSITIRCDTVKDKSDSKYIPENGVILEETEFEIEKGDTVYDILIEAAKKYRIHTENTGSEKMAYISGINYIYEFDFGDLSGWVYRVNGEKASVGCSEYKLSDGDKIEWLYSVQLGEDIK